MAIQKLIFEELIRFDHQSDLTTLYHRWKFIFEESIRFDHPIFDDGPEKEIQKLMFEELIRPPYL